MQRPERANKLVIAAAAVAAATYFLLSGCTPNRESESVWQGYVEAEYVDVSSSQSGRLDHLSVTRGQQVALGASLFALEAANEAAAQRQAQQQLDATEAQLADIKHGKRPQEQAVTRAQLEQAQAAAKKASIQLNRDQIQYQAGGIAKQQLDDSRAAFDMATAQVLQWQSQLAVDRLPNRDAQIRAQQAQVDASQAALEQAEWKLAQKTVSATRTGLVFDTMYREGEWVAAGNPVVRMLPPENVKARFFVPEAALGKLHLNQMVALRCDGCQKEVAARISYIATNAEYTPPIIYSNESRHKLVFMIEAHPAAGYALKLHPGQPLEVILK
ncbi:HlyD family secretion protein [Glaciimonas soli]|uniref:HlyD family efflux transporter periplasmic adaptor subunit n=1 Tax=Glaciimonas soli TaxID=2590999 RepID=A0A843YSP4_9BURK|nr:HlyD family efflux transporter periplasmic adaptor subunit [Glaciimonas soli]MQR00272.1 HlyD family efflux transporter periplasmic adaptor subunit [Glaciimonas soli]